MKMLTLLILSLLCLALFAAPAAALQQNPPPPGTYEACVAQCPGQSAEGDCGSCCKAAFPEVQVCYDACHMTFNECHRDARGNAQAIMKCMLTLTKCKQAANRSVTRAFQCQDSEPDPIRPAVPGLL
ncbi:MAG: hypothetical protein H0S85_15925 [Desulfovibrionaceae bacterium]|jgi:hypothetical protein|nr:hypothetical protein [Desulfovibrionaceae bacterium]